GELDSVNAGLAGPDTDDLLDVGDENLSIANAARLRRIADCLDDGIDILVRENDLDLHLRQEIDDIFGTTIQFGVPFLAPEAFRLRHGYALQADFLKGFLHFVQLERFDDGFDFFHEKRSLPDAAVAGSPVVMQVSCQSEKR